MVAEMEEASFRVRFIAAGDTKSVVAEQGLELVTGHAKETQGIGERHKGKPVAESHFATQPQTAAHSYAREASIMPKSTA